MGSVFAMVRIASPPFTALPNGEAIRFTTPSVSASKAAVVLEVNRAG